MNSPGPDTDGGAFGILRAFWRQWITERRLRQTKSSFRTTDSEAVAHAYGAMTPQEFETLNGPQTWLNARVIPRALSGRTNGHPWRVVDLGCGSGGSSALLMRAAPAGSTLVGYDLCADLVARARQRPLRDARGAPVAAQFVVQSIVEPLAAPDGGLLPPASVDLAHSAGIVGHHLREDDARRLAGELRRVLKPDGLAVLDAGPKLPPRRLARIMADAGFEQVACQRVVPWARRAALVFSRAAHR